VIRLRQVALIAPDLDPVVDELRAAFGMEVCFHDPGVAEFGLRNALLLVGDQFIEVLSPIADDTTVGRLLAKRGGAGGYMVIYEVDDLDARMEHVIAQGVRVVWAGDFGDIRGRHLHPRDVGGALVSLDEPVPPGSWRWGGPDWPSMSPTGSALVDAITGVTIGADDAERLAERWHELRIDEGVRFVEAGPRGEGLDGLELRTTDRARVGEQFPIGGVTFTLV
jgi:catechol 2,3-dioxygenase-like lactoylglutathione lyase family enzyme